jgi:hypothetical protein
MKIKRSPLKDRPLRNPGESLDERIRNLVLDYATGPVMLAAVMLFMTTVEWWKYYYSLPPKPLLYTTITAPMFVYATWRFFRVRSELKNYRLGRDGEKAVGQYLEKLREQGYRVFHDVVADGFNVDHVLIGPAGIFTVETKTHSKPSGNARVVFDGQAIRIDGCQPDRDPIVQAKAQASWLRELLGESTGRKFEVGSVIVYPGWFVENTGPIQKSMWVLNPKGLPTFLDHEPARLSLEDVSLASFHLGRFIRATELSAST